MTAPAPSVCQLCFGDGWAVVPGDEDFGWRAEVICPACTCATCGQTTDTPPVCRDCHEAERRADEDAAKAYRECRYE